MTDEIKQERLQKGRFAPGNSIAKGPRKRTVQIKEAQASALASIFAESDGDPIKIQQLMLKRGAELQLDVRTTISLCDKLSPFMAAKKASLDIKNEQIATYNVEFLGYNKKDEDNIKIVQESVDLLE